MTTEEKNIIRLALLWNMSTEIQRYRLVRKLDRETFSQLAEHLYKQEHCNCRHIPCLKKKIDATNATMMIEVDRSLRGVCATVNVVRGPFSIELV
jgi:hypothetical protein